jgi:hypothetical protein
MNSTAQTQAAELAGQNRQYLTFDDPGNLAAANVSLLCKNKLGAIRLIGDGTHAAIKFQRF